LRAIGTDDEATMKRALNEIDRLAMTLGAPWRRTGLPFFFAQISTHSTSS
jgi:hypothetical protein